MNTGSIIAGRPSMGSWIVYGLGAETENLPGFVVLMSSGKGGQMQPIAARQWSAGIPPQQIPGCQVQLRRRSRAARTHSPGHQRRSAEAIDRCGQRAESDRAQDALSDPEIQTRVAQYEMAFRMQSSVPDLVDMGKESQKTLDMYGAKPGDGSFASNCLLARRLAERGVRFIQLYHRDWDHHSGVKANVVTKASEVDQATAALITDLKQRGMLDDTLVVWGGEFGRTPMSQGGDGRDHHIKGFSLRSRRRRNQSPGSATARQTSSGTPPRRTPSQFPTSTRPCSTCSVSITNVLP